MSKKEKSRGNLLTEKQNKATTNIDSKSITEILEIINREDQLIANKTAEAIPEIEQAVELTTKAIRCGNRIIYIGAGTSGRLGVLDASEIPPTFSAPPFWFNGIIAGGDDALRRSIEGAEDKPQEAENDLKEFGLKKGDVLIGISTSGAAAYVRQAIDYANKLNCGTVYLICTPKPYYETEADVMIIVETGPEVITGSTRMKAGTATKLVLNMISTTTMIRLGKVYGNLMVDLMTVNEKLVDRGTRIICQLTDLNNDEAKNALFAAEKSVKNAIVMVRKNCSLKEAKNYLSDYNGHLWKTINE
jgi:N-acetylmuramic acid 6-phosphate etherase